MSILITELLDCGIVFGADRNVTIKDTRGDYQEQESKVFNWPRDDVIFGYVGVARLGGKPIREWLNEQLPSYSNITQLSKIADRLRYQIEEQRLADNSDNEPQALIIHLGGFEYSENGYIPQIWHIANVKNIGLYDYLEFSREFYAEDGFSEEMRKREITDSEIRDYLCVKAKQLDPFWFHQGYDYFAFNVLESSIKIAFKNLCLSHPDFTWPRTIIDWENQVRFSVLMYGAYFQAYRAEDQQYVGGGCEVVSIPWPTSR